MTVYTMAHIDVHDEEEYARYAELAGPAVKQYGGVFLARGGETVVMEGQARSRNVIIQWPDMDTAKAFYNGPEYQRALSHGLPAADRDYIFVEGV
ncbi:DUF1330 domain-containing protein [Neptunicoccus cionae]|uniref:DUF1330 domain-containing protein n=1 Tax=Neptunicoccus cionae TaxID=2035344 RepID=UPI000C76FF89|nr:DUF1330 domain-containing protein [Amylibacter cionae]MBR9863837.1 DUF1330 domain-containing protein [Paracoccaceae bacterium]PLS20526.1 DUF1330 domain-containing protein [Amylibacter cionae]